MNLTHPPPSTDRKKERGVATLVILVLTVLLGTLAAEFAYSAHVELESAVASYDRLRTEQLANSSLQIAQLLIMTQNQLQQQGGNAINIAPYADPLIQQVLLAHPDTLPSNSSLSLQMQSEEGKFPLSCVGGAAPQAEPQKTQQRAAYAFLQSLLTPSRLDRYFDRDTLDGFRLTRQELPRWIIDWIDIDERLMDPVSDSQGPEPKYDRPPLTYDMHNYYLDTLDELRLIRGLDQKPLLQRLKNNLTPYGKADCKISLGYINEQSAALWEAMLTASSSTPSTALDPNTAAVAQQLAAFSPYLEPLLRNNPLPKGQGPFCVSPGPQACPATASSSSGGTSSAAPLQGSKGGTPSSSDPLLTSLEEAICSPFLSQLPELATALAQSNPALAVPAQENKPANPLHPIPLCPGALGQFLRTTQGTSDRRFYRLTASGEVVRGQKPAMKTTIDALWDAAAYNDNPLCTDLKCKRGTWMYFRVH